MIYFFEEHIVPIRIALGTYTYNFFILNIRGHMYNSWSAIYTRITVQKAKKKKNSWMEKLTK